MDSSVVVEQIAEALVNTEISDNEDDGAEPEPVADPDEEIVFDDFNPNEEEEEPLPSKYPLRVLGSEDIEIFLMPDETILNMKIAIQQTYGLDVQDQRILYRGKALANDVNIPLDATSRTLQLIPYPNIKPNSDLLIKDVDEEIRLLTNSNMENVMDEYQNVPTIQRYLIDMLRHTMNDFDRNIRNELEIDPLDIDDPDEPRFPDDWEINIRDMRQAVGGMEQISKDYLDVLFEECMSILEEPDADLSQMGQLFSNYGTLLGSLGRLCCRVHPNQETNDVELRRGVNVEQVMVVQTSFSAFPDPRVPPSQGTGQQS